MNFLWGKIWLECLSLSVASPLQPQTHPALLTAKIELQVAEPSPGEVLRCVQGLATLFWPWLIQSKMSWCLMTGHWGSVCLRYCHLWIADINATHTKICCTTKICKAKTKGNAMQPLKHGWEKEMDAWAGLVQEQLCEQQLQQMEMSSDFQEVGSSKPEAVAPQLAKVWLWKEQRSYPPDSHCAQEGCSHNFYRSRRTVQIFEGRWLI